VRGREFAVEVLQGIFKNAGAIVMSWGKVEQRSKIEAEASKKWGEEKEDRKKEKE